MYSSHYRLLWEQYFFNILEEQSCIHLEREHGCNFSTVCCSVRTRKEVLKEEKNHYKHEHVECCN